MTRHGPRAPVLAPLLAGWAAGSALQLQQAALWLMPAYAGLMAAALVAGLALIRWEGRGWRPLACLLLALAAGFGQAGLRACAQQAASLDPALEGRDIVITGIVPAMPQRNEAGVRFRFDVESAVLGEAPVRLPPRILLGWYGQPGGRQPEDLRAGERWQFTARLKAPHGHSNPHGFDYELWLWEQGLQATGYVRDGNARAAPRRLEATWAHPVEQARQSVREAIFRRLSGQGEEDRRMAGIIAALVVGDQGAIDRADWDIFRATGVAHLMSISGLHVTLFAWAASLAVGWLWRRSARLCHSWPAPHAAIAGGLLLAAAYAVFSGWGVPAQRTVWMLGVAAVLRLSGRRWPWPHVWLAAMALVAALDPWALMQAGFWLSFVAVGVLFASEAGTMAPARTGWRDRLRAAAREQVVVTLALAPLSLLLFHQVSVIGLFANALAIPWVTLLVTPLALLGVAAPLAWDAAALALRLLDLYLRLLAAVPFATYTGPAPPLWATVAGVAGAGLLVMRWPWSLRLLGVPLLLPALLWHPERPPPGQFELLAADVGQGNAVIVRTASRTLVYDTGPRFSADTDAGERVLVPLLRALGERVETVVVSHRDADHSGGARAVLAMQPQARFMGSLEDGHELQAVRPMVRCVAGQSWTWDGVRFDILHPRPADYEEAGKPNAVSCVLKVTAAGASALLAGDVEAPQEKALVARGGLASDVLLVPHHGSKTSSTPEFLDAVAPRLALVQAGYRNRFGHPAEAVVRRYGERGIVLASSASCGAMAWSSAQPGRVRCHRDEARRYWHHGSQK
ncbi:MAG: DNA internalization-related competence protein ComEC/Rec2 [Burkholderiaceae bacterium]